MDPQNQAAAAAGPIPLANGGPIPKIPPAPAPTQSAAAAARRFHQYRSDSNYAAELLRMSKELKADQGLKLSADAVYPHAQCPGLHLANIKTRLTRWELRAITMIRSAWLVEAMVESEMIMNRRRIFKNSTNPATKEVGAMRDSIGL